MPRLTASQEAFYRIYNDEGLLKRIDLGLKPRDDGQLLFQFKNKFSEQLPERVVDIGCGDGAHTFQLSEVFSDAQIAGIDPFAPAIEQAIENCSDEDRECVSFLQGSIESLPFEDSSTDALWCFDMFCHVEDPSAALAECHRIMAQTARFLLCTAISTPNMDHTTWEALRPIGLHRSSMDSSFLTNAFESAGFSVLHHDNYRSEFLEAIEQEDPGRVSKDFMRLGRLARDPDHWNDQIGADNVSLLHALISYNLAILTGKLDYQAWILTKK
ncbi:MAG: class I SAM-dependent methyltransferase [Verrucomicrobiota bacterium]